MSALRIAQKTSLSLPPASGGGFCGVNDGYLSSGRRSAVQVPEPAQVERRVDLVHVVRAQLELAAEQRQHLGRDVHVDLEPHREPELGPLAQRDLHRGEQVFGLVAELDVGVARDPERILREHLHAREQRVEVRRDHLFEGDVARAARAR